MKELVNLSNYHLDNLLINNSAEELQNFLREHNLSGGGSSEFLAELAGFLVR